MTTAINWEPFVFTIEILLLFIGICAVACLSDIWAKGLKRHQKPPQPVATPKVGQSG